jgi:hypothetical protein
MNNFDTKTMTKYITDYYFFLADKLACRQDNLFRTYLWVASLLITLDVLMIKEFPIKYTSISMTMAISTLFILIATLAICVWCMRGKQSIRHPNILAYAKQDAPPGKLWTEITLLEDYWEVTLREEIDKSRRGLRLRDISLCLTTSVILLAVTVVIAIIERG